MWRTILWKILWKKAEFFILSKWKPFHFINIPPWVLFITFCVWQFPIRFWQVFVPDCSWCLIFLKNFIAEKPKLLLLSSNNIELIENITYVLSCSLLTGSKPVQFQWFHNSIQLSPNVNLKIDNSDSYSILTLRNIQQTNSGTYRCEVRNSFGTHSTSATILVKGLKCVMLFSFCSKYL